MSAYCDVIIPTFNNPQYLVPCVLSIIRTGVLDWMGRVIIVNNGDQPVAPYFASIKNVAVVEAPKDANGNKMNLGWEGGLALGLQYSNSPFVVFQNDDTLIPLSDHLMYHRLLSHFKNPDIGAVGPSTTVAMGSQSIFNDNMERMPIPVKFLIFFCVMVRRDYLDQVGGIDTSLPGGDDLDLSIRLRKAGKTILFDPFSFLIHHGFKTGERVEGLPSQVGGWNSLEKMEKTNQALIAKHGIREFSNLWKPFPINETPFKQDTEGGICSEWVQGDNIIEMGCGANKTVASSIGVDRVPYGEMIPAINRKSIADVVCDVEDVLPFPDDSQDTILARHILEHCTDVLGTLQNWSRILKDGGRLVVAVPNENQLEGIPLNPEHKHAFTPASLDRLMEASGFSLVSHHDPKNYVSFVGVYKKVSKVPAAVLV